jgi:hypothetical protein
MPVVKTALMSPLCFPVPPVDGLETNWKFTASPPFAWRSWRERLRHPAFLHVRPAPRFRVLVPPTPRSGWIALFIYSPAGLLDAAQRFTLQRLQDLGLDVLVVVATNDEARVPEELQGYCSALVWKALEGYDFSAYTIALRLLAAHSPGANVLLMNDSVFGPFSDFRPLLHNPPWALTGFTASGRNGNHLQSYALIFRNLTTDNLRGLSGILDPQRSFDHFDAVVAHQELRLAVHAARDRTVGALWYGDGVRIEDPTLRRPAELVQAGMPFMKKSLLGKYPMFNQAQACLATLGQHRHPLPEPAGARHPG